MPKRTVLSMLTLALALSFEAHGGGEDPEVEAARQDLARRVKVPLDMVQFVTRKPQVWPDSSMGCVRVGVPTEEIITKGSELVLVVAGQMHYYHALPGEPYTYCELPSSERMDPGRPPIK